MSTVKRMKKYGCFLILIGYLTVFGVLGFTREGLTASVPDIKIAVVYPLSGAYSRNGNLTVQGIKAAIGWVNDQGGIKSLGGAKLVPVVADCGSSVEGAASAMERVCRDPEIIMAMGSWASSFTMASTEVTERLGIPHFNIGFADSLHERGFKWGFYVTPPSSSLVGTTIPTIMKLAKEAGKEIKTAMYVGNNNVGSKYFYDSTKKLFGPLGVKTVGDETWAIGTLTDATPIIQKVKTLNPDIVIYSGDAISEIQMIMMKRIELGVKTPFACGGGWLGDPSLKFGAKYLDGWLAMTPSFPHKLTPEDWVKRSLDQCRKEYSDEPWPGQELSYAWTMVPIMAEILEKAGTRDRLAIRNAAYNLDIKDVMATRHMAAQGISFDETGRIAKKHRGVLIIQWQGGKPHCVYPPNLATAKPIWTAN